MALHVGCKEEKKSGYQGYSDVEVTPESTEPIRFLHSFERWSPR